MKKTMSTSNDWNPDQYLLFGNERTQPSIDLVNKIKAEQAPIYIADIGCGPGNSSQVLLQRWPEAKLTGVDSSPAMIEKAKTDYPGQNWILANAIQYETDLRFSLIFSNAAIQWIPGHDLLFMKFIELLAEKGIIAIQFPQFREMALGKIVDSVARSERWRREVEGCLGLFTYHPAGYYYDLLVDKMNSIEMWETDYMHIMSSHLAIVDWIKSTGLRPFLERISDEQDRKDFETEILHEIEKNYPQQKNGSVLFPFKRFFLIAYK